MTSLPMTRGLPQSTISTVFEYTNDKWVRRIVENEDLLGVRSNLYQASQNTGTKIIFANSKDIDYDFQLRFCEQYEVPSTFWSQSCEKLNGFFGSSTPTSVRGNIEKHRTWFKVIVKHFDLGIDEYYWSEMRFFSLWTPQKNILICFDCPGSVSDDLWKTFDSASDEGIHPAAVLSLHTKVLEHITTLYDRSIWDLARRTRGIEKRRSETLSPASAIIDEDLFAPSSFQTLHDLARHTAHSVETTNVASDIVSRIIRHGVDLGRRLGGPTSPMDLDPQIESLLYQHSILTSLTERSKSNEKRLSNEINLLFNLITQRDSKAIQLDSSAMKAIATVTLVFLPATFVSAIFGMTFFNFQPASADGDWAVSRQIWIYFAFAAPLTIVSLWLGDVWRRKMDPRPVKPLIEKGILRPGIPAERPKLGTNGSYV